MGYHWGRLLKNSIEKSNISIEIIAKRAERTTQAVYSDLKKESLKTDVVEKYCEALGISITDLIEGALPLVNVGKYYGGWNDDDLIQSLKECNERVRLLEQANDQSQLLISTQHSLIENQKELIANLKQQLASEADSKQTG